MNAINTLLKSFAFTTFELKEGDAPGTYALRRPNGDQAKDTLSDGEKSFLTFLYFHHLVKGSYRASGTTSSRVVVVDDPVSSLDSDVLFVVSHLIRNIIKEARSTTGRVAQVFVLTHNVYFHKEITVNAKRRNNTPKPDESFWLVRREDKQSRVERCATNPVTTGYDMLWADVRSATPPASTICNTLRRILEYYFKMLGGYTWDQLDEKFAGEEQVTCRALLSYIHAGSHSPMDDLYISPSKDGVSKYLNVFREIFEKTGHMAHYNMMMGDACQEDGVATVSP